MGWHTVHTQHGTWHVHGVHTAHTGWHTAHTWSTHGTHTQDGTQHTHMGWHMVHTRGGTQHTHMGWHTAHTHGVAHGTHTGWYTAHTQCPHGTHTHGVAHSTHAGWHSSHTHGVHMAHTHRMAHRVQHGAHMTHGVAHTRGGTQHTHTHGVAHGTHAGWHSSHTWSPHGTHTQDGTQRAHTTHTRGGARRTHGVAHGSHGWCTAHTRRGTRLTRVVHGTRPGTAHRPRAWSRCQECLAKPPPWRTAKARLSPAPAPSERAGVCLRPPACVSAGPVRVWAGCDVILSDTAAAVPFVHTTSALLALLTPPPSGVSRSLSPPRVSGSHVGCRGASLATRQGWKPGGKGVSQGLGFGAQDSGAQSRAALQAHPGSGSADLPAGDPRGPVTWPRSHSRVGRALERRVPVAGQGRSLPGGLPLRLPSPRTRHQRKPNPLLSP